MVETFELRSVGFTLAAISILNYICSSMVFVAVWYLFCMSVSKGWMLSATTLIAGYQSFALLSLRVYFICGDAKHGEKIDILDPTPSSLGGFYRGSTGS